MKNKHLISTLLTVVLVVMLAAGCTAPNATPSAGLTNQTNAQATLAPYESRPVIKIGALKGPTGIGLVKLMEDNANKTTLNQYKVDLYAAPTDLVGLISTGEIDIAAVPTNLAATLYNKTNGKVQLLALNTLGVLYILEKGNTIESVDDLKGKTIYTTGQGSTPEYALRYILAQNGIDPDKDVTIEFKADHAELATLALAGQADIVMLPEPFVTTVLNKDSAFRVALDINELWNTASDNSSIFSMGALIVRKDFAQANKDVLDAFLTEYKASAEFASQDIEQTAALTEKYGIIASKALAAKAIPNCNIVYIDGAQMKTKTQPYLELLFGFDPKSVGGKLPNEDFYYQK